MFPATPVSRSGSVAGFRRLFDPALKTPKHDKQLYPLIKDQITPKQRESAFVPVEEPIVKHYEKCKDLLQKITHSVCTTYYKESYKQINKITAFISRLCNKIYDLENAKIDSYGFFDPKILINVIRFSDMNLQLIEFTCTAARKIESIVPLNDAPSADFISIYQWLAALKQNFLKLLEHSDSNLSATKTLPILKQEGEVFIEHALVTLSNLEKNLTEHALENNSSLFISTWRTFRPLYAQIALLEKALSTLTDDSQKLLLLEEKANKLIQLFGFLRDKMAENFLTTEPANLLLNDLVSFDRESFYLLKYLLDIVGKENNLLARFPLKIHSSLPRPAFQIKKTEPLPPKKIYKLRPALREKKVSFLTVETDKSPRPSLQSSHKTLLFPSVKQGKKTFLSHVETAEVTPLSTHPSISTWESSPYLLPPRIRA